MTEELVEDHNEELTTEELLELQNEQMKVVPEEHSSEEGDNKEDVTTAKINKIRRKWSDVQEFIEKHHPNKLWLTGQ